MGNITRVYRLGDLQVGEPCTIRFKTGSTVSGAYGGQGREIGSFLLGDNVFYCEFVAAIFAGA